MMATREQFRNLAQMARRISANIINQDIVDRLNAISRDFDHQAEEAPDADPPDWQPPQRTPGKAGLN
jgi:hypothetical protein